MYIAGYGMMKHKLNISLHVRPAIGIDGLRLLLPSRRLLLSADS
jgi:hypothetical protein